jgi:hypothetical protein
VIVSADSLLRRADAARKLVAAGELEPMDGLKVVLFPSPELLALERPAEVFSSEVQTSEAAPSRTRAVRAAPHLTQPCHFPTDLGIIHPQAGRAGEVTS